ncbi:MAG TPA: choice-of-anchor Q domain-containing protein, partial [Opitutaceae bacterium]|nr:choice-of-anchor Q domain-containing protein [Opitutaceae bacterium]
MSFVLGLFCAGTAAAATRTVTTNTDLGAGSLRQAIADSTSGDTILFALPSGSETITLGSELAISGKSLTVDGANTVVAGGSGTAVTITVPVPGTSPHRVFHLAPGTGNTVALSHLTLCGGSVAGTGLAGEGGVILCNGGALGLDTVTLRDGRAANGGGLAVDFGAVATLTNCTISGNSATNSGGGLLVDVFSTATLTQTTVSDNSATQRGGGLFVYGTATLLDTIAIANTASDGDDLYIQGTLRAYASWYAGTYGSIATDPVAPNLTTAYTAGDLGALADNGGPTQTHALARTAPAVGAGVLCYRNATDGLYFKGTDAPYYKVAADGTLSSFTPSASQLTADRLATDQRGVERNAPVDLGAFQLVRVATAAAPAAGTYKAGATLSFTVTFSDTVAVSTTGGTPRLALTIGAATRYATYDAAASTDTSLVFTYTVAAGDTDADGLAVASPTIDLNGGTLTDAGGCPVVLALPAYTLPTIRVDTTAPAVATIARTQPGPVTLADTLEWRVTFTEAVTGVDAADFALTAVDGAATATLGTVTAGANAAEYFVTATGVAGVGTLRLDVKASGTEIVDGSANALAAGFTLGQPYTHTSGSVAVSWGDNGFGQLGNNSTTASSVPLDLLGTGALAGKTVVAVALGFEHSLALCSDGTVAAWGRNMGGQLGNNSTTSSSVPVAVSMIGGTSALAGKTVVAVAAGESYSLALCSDGTVAAWGRNSFGQLGNNSTTDSLVPVAVNTASGTSALSGKTVVAVSAGTVHSLALCSDGTVAAWGFNTYGSLGNASTAPSGVPVAVNTGSGTSALSGKTVVAVSAGGRHSLALCSDGTVAAWGSNDSGQLGNNSAPDSPVPVAVNTGSGTSALSGKTVVAVAAGGRHSLALCSDGTVAAWGSNDSGQLGNNSAPDSPVPVAVNTGSGMSALSGKTVVAVSAGGRHSLALCNDGTVATWGNNRYGELGNNSTTDSLVPVAVNTASPSALSGKIVSFIGTGGLAYHTLALASPPPPVTVTAVSTPAAGSYKAGDTLNFTLTT